MHKALIYSVPGTGTRFATQFVEKVLGYKLMRLDRQLLDSHKKDVWSQTHADVSITPFIDSKQIVKFVVPLRDPYLAYVTRNFKSGWTRRQKIQMQAPYIKLWETLIENVVKADCVFLPVDTDLNRIMLLQSVANHLDAKVELKLFFDMVYDWPKVGTMGMSSEKELYLKTGMIRGEKPTFLDFAVDWYDATIARLEEVF